MAQNNPIEIKDVNVTSDFWSRYRKLVAEVGVPYQYSTISDENGAKIGNDSFTDMRYYKDGLQSHALENLKIAAGMAEGNHVGMNFQDTDVYKWLEAAAYTLKYYPDEKLRKETDEVVDIIAKAQEPDGYLSTIFQINFPERKFKRLQQSHELYSMGHYIEAGVAYYEVTGSEKALDIARKMADCLDENFGPKEDQIHGYGGHPEIELALMRLWEVTKEDRYLQLTNFFIRERGQDPQFFDKQNEADGIDNDFWPELRTIGEKYYFADKPVTEQEDAHGHAVRCVYLLTGLAHLARVTGADDLQQAADRLWNNIVKKQMYITGNVGQTAVGEAFTYDYDLPNDTDYGETCASVAMTVLARQMLKGDFKAEYADVIEKELFNGALSGISLDGTHYFYVNPLEADPEASTNSPLKNHILGQRQAWFGTACCPSNITRLIASVDRYLYEVKDDTIFAHQYIANETSFSEGINIKQDSNLPWDGDVSFKITNPNEKRFNFVIRIPNWSRANFTVKINGNVIEYTAKDGTIKIEVTDSETTIEIQLDMNVHNVKANPKVKADVNKVAFQRGPLVYCAEEADNEKDLWQFKVDEQPKFDYTYNQDLLDGVGVLTTSDVEKMESTDNADLYQFDEEQTTKSARLTLVPYYAWANRSEGQMSVWFNQM
ncbi:beta-L-arabinofuranosidase domain-containing protein [Lentilactobacillus sp. Marseille-Q4993]|uniref:glycoside hydrolase family 127 protein n=1 Tax=Lentilactobacillus sp. Marseille-Q4993 TaxID=3039492 RepID=UPI0024BD3C09|nr:beta-L-arabinofuranosidase domain-containing protein [Lentilactobacillus sp. Marseille-Q4993]